MQDVVHYAEGLAERKYGAWVCGERMRERGLKMNEKIYS